MDDLAAINRELDVAREREDNGARVRLIPRVLALPEAQPLQAEYLDELAYAYQQLGRFDEAIDTMRRAVAAGWDGELAEHPSAEALIADLLLQAGRTQEAEEAWLRAERRTPRDPHVHQAAGTAYARVGLHGQALEWQTKGLELALEADEAQGALVLLLTEARAETLEVLGRAPDELQLRAAKIAEPQQRREREYMEELRSRLEASRPAALRRGYVGLVWFPAEQYERALEMWSSFAEDYEHSPYAAYCARLELLLRELRSQGTPRLALVPIAIDEYLSWCAEHGQDPSSPPHEPAMPPSSSKGMSSTPGRRNATSRAGARASTRSAAFARGDARAGPVPGAAVGYLLCKRPDLQRSTGD